MKRIAALVLLAAAAAVPATARAQGAQPPPDIAVDAATRTRIVEAAIAALDEAYVFPDVAKTMGADLRARLARGEFDRITHGPVLADILAFRLLEASGDRHLSVRFSPAVLPPDDDRAGGPSPEELAEFRKRARRENYGFGRVDRLPGNIGYLSLRGFTPPAFAGDTAAAAMSYLSNTDALIVDLRQNGGGDPGMVQFLCSYFFDGGEPVHLNDLYFRPNDSTQQFWTLGYVPGPRYVGKDVYVLTSGATFSAAEEFSYNLKTLKRATIVGETTGGGANPGDGKRLGDHFVMFVPNGRAINPITKTNWEGVGVAPDIEAPADLALETAQLEALRRLAAKETDPRVAGAMRGQIESLTRELAERSKSVSAKPAASRAGNTQFRLAGAARARRVAVAGSFNDWSPTATWLERVGDAWVGRADLPAGTTTYKFVVDGRWTVDPDNPRVEANERGEVNSVIVR